MTSRLCFDQEALRQEWEEYAPTAVHEGWFSLDDAITQEAKTPEQQKLKHQVLQIVVAQLERTHQKAESDARCLQAIRNQWPTLAEQARSLYHGVLYLQLTTEFGSLPPPLAPLPRNISSSSIMSPSVSPSQEETLIDPLLRSE